MYVYVSDGTYGIQKKALSPLKLNLQKVVSF